MLDRKFILENSDAVKENCSNRGVSCDVDQLVSMEHERRALLKKVEQLNREANEVSKSIGKANDESEREARKQAGRELRDAKDATQKEHDDLARQIEEIQAAIPNMAHPDAPIGKDDKSNLELKRGKHAPREFTFPPRDHVELGQQHDWIDFEGGGPDHRRRVLLSQGRRRPVGPRVATICGRGADATRVHSDGDA